METSTLEFLNFAVAVAILLCAGFGGVFAHLYYRLGKLDDRTMRETSRLHNRVNDARDAMTASELRILRSHATKEEMAQGFDRVEKGMQQMRDDTQRGQAMVMEILTRVEAAMHNKADKQKSE